MYAGLCMCVCMYVCMYVCMQVCITKVKRHKDKQIIEINQIIGSYRTNPKVVPRDSTIPLRHERHSACHLLSFSPTIVKCLNPKVTTCGSVNFGVPSGS